MPDQMVRPFLPPIAIMSFNRPNFLGRVLKSLKAQSVDVEDRSVHLFQDGARSPFGGRSRANPEDIAASIAVFQHYFPAGVVHHAPYNLGVALNFERAEKFVFDEMKADLGVFFEDDMVLSRYYLDTLQKLSDFALSEERVGYVAAYGVHRASNEEQKQLRRHLVPMGHNWGFALTRRQWQRQREIVEEYLGLVRNSPYSERPDDRIRAYFSSLGLPIFGTSQDAAKEVACAALGTVRLMCFPAQGHYIGDVGEHYNPELYKSMGYDETVFFDEQLTGFDFPTSDDLAIMAAEARVSLIDREQSLMVTVADEELPSETFVQSLYWGLLERAPDRLGFDTFTSALNTGEMQPAEIVRRIANSEEFRKRQLARITQQAASDISAEPRVRQSVESAETPANELQRKLFAADVYAGFTPNVPVDLQGWNSRHPALERELLARRPRIVIDVGVWKGGSTIYMAKHLKAQGVNGAVIAIDTFLGSPEHWNRECPDRIFEDLKMRHGWPSLYWQFLSNVVHEGVSAFVVPLAQTSENAMVILKRLGVRAGVIHIDAAHEYEAVLRDARQYWDLLEPGGILIGDDYPWPGVARAARDFATEVGLTLRVEDPKWLIEKPT
ncbi:class I SAM-dependent methyltransferase [Roseomonas gilardii]|uniref:class I SAM-dependent methyltransferase n=1 Tax=Roseomonas gilardii TaxID=257708 RepID=UPI000ACFE82B|nr:class I SAM-dependent methyltransferase [Roseomonas gilardii]